MSAQLNTIQQKMGLDTIEGFEALQRCARLISSSTIVPKEYQGEKGLPNAVIALNMACRMGADPLMVMQNLFIVHGRPSWSSQFMIAAFNQCGRFQSIRYEFKAKENSDDWGCRAWTVELSSGEKIIGPWITIGIAKKERWYDKDGSKWKTMPEQMLRYRAASWLIRTTAPEITMGLKTNDEIEDAEIIEESEYYEKPVISAQTITEPAEPTEAGWTEEESSVFELLMSRIKAQFKLCGKEADWPDYEAKQRERIDQESAKTVINELNEALKVTLK